MKSKDIKKIYSDLAKKYDVVAIERGYNAYEVMNDWALKTLKNKKANILDLGCGTGLSSVKFIKKGHKVVGIDFSKEMLAIAQKYSFEKLICQDLEKPLKVENNQFDLVMLIGVTGFIKKPLSLLKQIKNKLKGGGFCLVTFPKKLSPKSHLTIKSYTKEEAETILANSGLKLIGSKSFFGYWKKIENRKESINYYGYILKK